MSLGRLARQPEENGSRHDGFRIRTAVGLGLSSAVKRSARSTIEGLAGATVLAQMEQLVPPGTTASGSKSERTLQRAGTAWSTVSLEAVVFTSGDRARQVHRPHLAERGITRTRRLPEM
jgi:hypothetical protein